MSNNGDVDSAVESRPLLSSAQQTKSGWTPQVILAGSAAVVGSSFQFGYNLGVINAPGHIIKDFFNETYFDRYGSYIGVGQLDLLWGIAVSIFAIGGMIGSAFAGYFAKRWGRKKSMFVNNILVLIAIIFMGFSKIASSYEILIVGRLIIGINCGFNTGLAPLYLTEISPVYLRGIFGTFNQLGIVFAILISEILGLSIVLGTVNSWPILLAFTGVFGLYQLIVLPFCPDTPASLLGMDLEVEARKSLQYLRNDVNVEQELETLISERNKARSERRVTFTEIFKRIDLRKPMIIAIVLQLSQQLSGINSVFFYSTSLFVSAHVPQDKSDFVTVGIGVANVIMIIISLFLIDRFGRRILMLVGLAGMCLCSIILVLSLTVWSLFSWGKILAVIMVIVYVISFQSGPGPIPWFITAELFSQGARTTAISIAGVVNWTGSFLVGVSYPSLQHLINGYTFVIFACLLALFWLFTYFKVPETKGKTTEEISNLFKAE